MGMLMTFRRVDGEELARIERDPDLARLLVEDADDSVDLDKAWHAVHYLLNGSAWGGSGPAFDAVLGGTHVGEPTSYEPVRLLGAEQVAAVAVHLREHPMEVLKSRFRPHDLKQAEVYPDIWDEPDVLMAYVRPHYEALQAFYAEAAAAGDAVLIVLS